MQTCLPSHCEVVEAGLVAIASRSSCVYRSWASSLHYPPHFTVTVCVVYTCKYIIICTYVHVCTYTYTLGRFIYMCLHVLVFIHHWGHCVYKNVMLRCVCTSSTQRRKWSIIHVYTCTCDVHVPRTWDVCMCPACGKWVQCMWNVVCGVCVGCGG